MALNCKEMNSYAKIFAEKKALRLLLCEPSPLERLLLKKAKENEDEIMGEALREPMYKDG